ncbi:arrestin domain-containing protein 1 isoform X3 [Cephus cinctus]|uniref:Arrestin domain-containing protein 1 isoform X3 n=1 Tax=Cephus cinctus TaxID=211228 RepID=A0AAJ7CD54_CEPCN|nr:arrestin domain-containing protein 1 isoform X3 [Cephus cinctus]
MSIDKFDIQLDKKSCIYEPGEIINGQVLTCLENPKPARGLKIKIKGKCHVQWRRNGSKASSKIVSGSERYIDLTEYLIGCADGSYMKLPAGEQSYPFSFQLPETIPVSFEHKYGSVIYTLKAAMDLPLSIDPTVTKRFTVVSNLDLNNVPEARREIHDERTIPFSNIFCCSVGEIDMLLTLPVRGYVAGQNIEAKVCFDNKSEVEIDEIKLNFIQTITFKVPSGSQKKIEKNILGNKTLYGPFGQSGEYDASILVRSVPVSYFPCCKLIDIDYDINVKYVISGCHYNVSNNYPIFIGTIPLISAQSKWSTASVPVEATEPIAPCPPGPEVPIAPYPPGPEVPIAPCPPGPEVPIAPCPPEPEIPNAPYPPEPEVPIATYPPEQEVPFAPCPPGPVDRPMPINCQPMPQNYKLEFENYKPGAGKPVTGMPFVVPVPGPSTQPIGFVVPPELPPPSYEDCSRESHPVDQKQESNSDADVKQPLIPPYPLDNLPYKNN